MPRASQIHDIGGESIPNTSTSTICRSSLNASVATHAMASVALLPGTRCAADAAADGGVRFASWLIACQPWDVGSIHVHLASDRANLRFIEKQPIDFLPLCRVDVGQLARLIMRLL